MTSQVTAEPAGCSDTAQSEHFRVVGVQESVTVTEGEHGGKVVVIREVVLIEVEDLEHHGKHGTKPQRAKSYRIVVDRQPHVLHQHEVTGRQILQLAGKAPDKFTLTEKLHGGKRVRIEPDDVVVLHDHGVERFETAPKSASNGDAGFRGPLTADDAEYLHSTGYSWHVAQDSGGWAVILKGYRLPAAFVPSEVDLMVRVPPHYPATPLDMFNVTPQVRRADGRPIACLSVFPFQGQTWQQWSRHRLPGDPWVPSIDGLATHMALVENALAADAAS